MNVKKRRVRWTWAWVVVPVVAGGGYFLWQRQVSAGKAAELPKGVQVGKVQRGDLDQKISATGVVAAQIGAKVNIGSQISGRIKSLPADVGAHVVKDQIVAVVDAPDLQAQVEQQQRNVDVSRANLAQAVTRLDQAQLNVYLSRDQTQAQIQEANSAVRGARAHQDAAEASAKMQPSQTTAEITRSRAALNTAKSGERQVQQTVQQQLLQAQTSVDELKASVDNLNRLRRRREVLLAQGFISRQEVDDTRTDYQQAVARMQSARANLDIVKEKTTADLQNAHDQVVQAQAAFDEAVAAKEQDTMRAAEARNAREGVNQAQATLTLRRTNRTQDRIRGVALEEAKAAVQQAKAALRQTQALLDYQQAQLQKAVIRSPINGTVLTVNTQQGETVAAGFQVQTLITVADLNRLEVRAYVDETDIGRVRIGLPAEVRVQSYQDRIFHGHVAKIASASTVKDNVVTYETTVAIDDANGLLRPDMTADVTLILGRRPHVLTIPSEAVHQEVGRTLTYVLHREKQGPQRAELRTVTIGFSDGVYTEVRSGLKEGEEVILAGLPRLGVQAVDAQSTDPNKNRKQQ